MSLTKERLKENIHTYLPLLPLMFAVGVIPLIVRIQYYDPNLAQYSWFSDETYVMDMFMYWKNKAMMQLDAVLLIGYVYLIWKKELPKEKIFIPLGIYALLVVASSICSVAPEQTWNGFFGMLESAFAVFGYCMVCYYAAAVIKNEKQLKLVMGALCIGVFIMGGIGLSQFLEHDFYMSDMGKNLIFPSKYAGYKEMLKITMGEGRVYASLYNPNYVGVYGCLLLPVFVVFMFTSKKRWKSILYFILASLIMVCIVGAENKTAILVFVPTFLFIAVYFGKKYWKQILITYILMILVFVGCNIKQGERSLISQVWSKVTMDSIRDGDDEEKADDETYALQEITLNDEDIRIKYNDELLAVKYLHNEDDSWTIGVTDELGVEIKTAVNEEESGYYLQDDRYEGLEFIFSLDNSLNVGFKIVADETEYFVYYSEVDETYYYINYYGKRAKIYNSETFNSPVFNLMGGFSGRGYIWSKSIPILKQTLLIGTGPDTYAFMFPQYDYVSLKENGWEKQLITKPHSMYLQMGIQTGLLSLLSFLVFYSWYFIRSFKLYWKKSANTFSECCGIAVWMGSFCFMLSSMTNDSTIGVSIIYWTLLGVGIACNIINEKKLNIDLQS